jgi:hypothetical protein
MRKIENLKFKIESASAKASSDKNCGISFLLRLITAISLLFRPKATSEDIKKIEFSASTQKMGVRFTDKIRDIFRYRWIKRN